ncbi:hypothetical protein HYC85_022611 [Camellia sinensis]|uniref:Ubiquitin-like domain-containing protein n=1 Tax=Camellia sinensis TaxID=4442 RepID=A0A7J7GCA3_CAMSI|nr:hypothetical protein HYC85_022611 [Camellia sinensis]
MVQGDKFSGLLKEMGSKGSDEVIISGSEEANCSEATVEIKIKTLDSQTYTLRVPVPALKEQIATVTGVLSEQQRLICRGKVLKDDQLLSAYPTDPASGTNRQGTQAGPSVVVGTFNISEQGDGVLPDFSRIVSAVLSSFGITNAGSGNEGTDLREAAPERLLRTLGVSGLRNSSGQQTDQNASMGQSNPHNGGFQFSTSVPLEPLHPPVIPDSLTTLSQYLTRLRHEFIANVWSLLFKYLTLKSLEFWSCQSETIAILLKLLALMGATDNNLTAAAHSAGGRAGLPTPASLAEVMLSTRQILTEQVADCLAQLARQLEDQATVNDPLTRMSIQSNTLRSAGLFRDLGALMLELGRTTMTLRIGQAPADAVVNAGPAVYISTSGPNPIMVQPLPFQPGTSFGAIPAGTIQLGSGLTGGSPGSGFLPRNIDIRIRTGSLMPSATVDQREPAGAQQSSVQNNPPTSGGGISNQQSTPGASGSPSSTRESEIRVVPIRTVVAAVPTSVRRSPSDSSHGSMGLFYPVLARVQHVASGNLNNVRAPQASDERHPAGFESGQHHNPDSAVQQQNIGLPGAEGNIPSGDGTEIGQGFSTQIHGGLDQLLRSIFPGEHIHVGDVNFHGMGTSSAAVHTGTTQSAATTQVAAPREGDEGLFLSNLLRQIMPIISESTTSGSSIPSSEGAGDIEDRTTQASSTQGPRQVVDMAIHHPLQAPNVKG